MKIAFRKTKLNAKSMAQLNKINDIVADYQSQGYKLTLRQLYYQLVSKNVIANEDRQYKKLGRLLVEGRMAGIVDWDAIEDRLRTPTRPYAVDDIADALDDTFNQYRLQRQKGQDVLVEVWVEKDAISNVLKRVTEKYGVSILVNRGYGSASAMKDAYDRYKYALSYGGKDDVVILYLGDHDPIGLDMIRDIEERVGFMLSRDSLDRKFSVEPIALTMTQIRKYNPPSNPAKITDSRSGEYIAKYGRVSWEVDALPPEVLHKVLEDAIRAEIDVDKYDKVVKLEAKEKAIIGELVDQYKEDNE